MTDSNRFQVRLEGYETKQAVELTDELVKMFIYDIESEETYEFSIMNNIESGITFIFMDANGAGQSYSLYYESFGTLSTVDNRDGTVIMNMVYK